MKQLHDPRQLRGLEILSEPDMIRAVGNHEWAVKSQNGNGEYTVSRARIGHRGYKFEWACTCPDYTYRKTACKHIFAVQFSLELKKDIEQHSQQQAAVQTVAPVACPACASVQVIRRGVRKTSFGEVQRYGCKGCGHRFTVDTGFRNMKHDPKVITLALDLYFKGVSLRKIADHLKQFHEIDVVQTTPMRWIKKYLKLLAQYVERHKADVGKIWHSDEMTVFIKKNGEKKYYEWIWNVMDAKTRYLLACQVTETRFVDDAQKPLQQAKAAASTRPHAVVTDGLQAYKQAIKNEFYDPNALVVNPHLRLKDFETKPNNNIVERLNGTFRERTKVMRSLPDQISANEFCAGMQVYYNYIRPHQGIEGLTPAQMANIPINLSGNRWMTMIELATKS
jgi:transposase-like protein